MNRNEHRRGSKVECVTDSINLRHKDFPGWGADNYIDFLIPATPGLVGVVTDVESHGQNPWTRYSVRFSDGSRGSGMIEGTEIVFID